MSIYGEGEVLGILTSREEDAHFIAKRAAGESEVEEGASTTASPPGPEEFEDNYIYVANGKYWKLYGGRWNSERSKGI